MRGEWVPARGSNRGDPGPDARVKFPSGPQARSASSGPAPLTQGSGWVQRLASLTRGAGTRSHIPPFARILGTVVSLEPLLSTPCAGIVGTRLPSPCAALRPARPRTPTPQSGILGIVVTRDPVLPEPHSAQLEPRPSMSCSGILGISVPPEPRFSSDHRHDSTRCPSPCTQAARMGCGPARPPLLLAHLGSWPRTAAGTA